jgi:hypothetical protein
VDKSGSAKLALMHVDADAHDGKGNRAGHGLRFDQDAACLASADQQIVGPAQIDRKAGDGANGIGGGQSRGQRQQRQTAAGIGGRSSTLT